MLSSRRSAAGFTLLELILVIAIIAILVALVMPNTQPDMHSQLQAAARIAASDLSYGRALAITNNSTYRFTFDLTNNQYVMEHSGANAALNTLPVSPFRNPGDPPTKHIVDLDDLPHVGSPVRLLVAARSGSFAQKVDTVEFGPLGSTTSSIGTTLWLSAGSNADTRYITVNIDPVTGLATIGTFTTDGPPTELLTGSPSH